MLDINFIINNKNEVAKAVKNKGIDINLDDLLKLNQDRLVALQGVESLQHKRNEHATHVKQSGKGLPDAKLIKEGKKIKVELSVKEEKLRDINSRYSSLMLEIPNVYSKQTPVGKDDRANKVIRTVGKPPKFKFKIKDHSTLGQDLDLIDTDRGTKVSGFRGYFLKNDLVLLQWGLFSFCLRKMQENGFQLMIPPTMVRDMALLGSGHFPSYKEEIYPVDDNFLAGTSEAALLAYRAEEMLSMKELPLKYCAVSPCYRREIGSYGKDTRGVYRVHEFWKIEQVVICKNDLEGSQKLFQEMLSIAEGIIEDLGLPYRVVAISTGDMGAGKYEMFDIETWMPSRDSYGETHSCSHMTDWQSRRLKMRYKDADGKIVYPYTMNNTVIASPRIMIALMENYQQKDGSIRIPEVLQKYMSEQKTIRRDDA